MKVLILAIALSLGSSLLASDKKYACVTSDGTGKAEIEINLKTLRMKSRVEWKRAQTKVWKIEGYAVRSVSLIDRAPSSVRYSVGDATLEVNVKWVNFFYAVTNMPGFANCKDVSLAEDEG